MTGTNFQAAAQLISGGVEAVVADIFGAPGENDIPYDFKCNGGIVRVRKGGANHDAAFVYAKDQSANDNNAGAGPYRLEQDAVFYCHDFTGVRYALKQGEEYVVNAHGTRIFILKSDDLLNGDADADWDVASANAEELARIIDAAAPGYEFEQPQPEPAQKAPMLAAALAYAEQGWDVFPAPPGEKKSYKSAKHSNGAKWGKTRDPEQIRRDFQRWLDANIGIPTGKDNGFWVFETDTKEGHDVDGEAALRKLEAEHGPLPDTLMAISPSGSKHRYFGWPDGVEVRNSASVVGPGIDVRGEGGMVIAPPSVRGDGAYRWLNDNPIADAPQWLIDLVTTPKSSSKGKDESLPQLEIADAFKDLPRQQNLAGGIEFNDNPLPLEPILAECGWLRHVHATGGADQSEILWRDALRVCMFLENGESLIHAFSNKYDGYDSEATEAKFDEARKAKEDKDLGWPLCKTICDHGSTHCKSCPHLAEGKSPLNLALQAPPAPADNFKPSDEYDHVDRDAPELAKVDAVWVTRIFEGDTDGTYQNDQSQLAFAVACELVRIRLDNSFIARVLMTTKCGDYVQERPAYRLLRTIRRAHEFMIDPDLEVMNSQHAVLPIGDKTRVVTWGDDPDFPGRKTIIRAQTFDDFKNLHSNKRKRVKTTNDAGKKATTTLRLGHWWLAQRHRRQYDGGQRFMPQHEAEVVGNVLNMFEGFPIQPRKPEGRSAASGCQLFLDHGLKIICSGNEEHWDYLHKREAWIAQNRRRSEVAAAYRTEEEGSGKGFWCNQLGHLYKPHYMQVIKPEHVVGKHNRHLETLLKLCADEALFVGDPRHRNTLFGLITEPTVDIEPKFIDAYPAQNYLNIDIISNAKHFVPVSRTARRFFIPTVSENRVGDFEYFKAIERQLKDGGYEALLYHLLHEVDLRDFEVRRVPKTAGLAEQADYSRKGVDGLVEKICSEGCVPCAHLEWPGFSVSNGYEERQGFDYFIDNHVDRELHYLAALKVKRQLCKEWRCITGKNARRRDGSDIINGVQWPPLQELRELFVQRHGPQDWLNPDSDEWPVHTTSSFQVARRVALHEGDG